MFFLAGPAGPASPASPAGPAGPASILVHSAADLTAASSCEFSLLRTLDVQLGRVQAEAVADPMLERLSRLGTAHEQSVLRDLRGRFGDAVAHIGRPGSLRIESEIVAAAQATLAAVARRAPVIYQGTIYARHTDAAFLGFSDFLVLDPEKDCYEVIDTKLARHEQVSSILQIAAYADALDTVGVPVADTARLILGDGSTHVVDIADVRPVYRRARDGLIGLLRGHQRSSTPASWEHSDARCCGRCAACAPQVERTRDLLLVAGMRSLTRERLHDGGVTTIDDLATATSAPPGLARRTFESLRAQASAQIRQETEQTPVAEFVAPGALAALPATDPGDIFFDFEGDPLWTQPGDPDWGLEYLFGVLENDGDEPVFRPFFAHNRAQEKRTFSEFLDYLDARRTKYPSMHVYHYAPYERAALLRLAGRHGIGETTIDDLLRKRVLIDLFPIVRASLRVGARSYSLKKLEPLYMPAARDGDVTDAAASITEYARYTDLVNQGSTNEAAAVLAEIADYNRYDCRSTLELRDWLLRVAEQHHVSPLEVAPAPPAADERTDVELALTEYAGDGSERTDDQQAVAMLAAAIGYHRREDKPFWWGHFDRLSSPIDEWADTKGTFVVADAECEPWQPKVGNRLARRVIHLRGVAADGALGSEVHVLYDAPAPEWLDGIVDPTARWTMKATVVDISADGTEVVVEERLTRTASEYHALPVALSPTPGPSSTTLIDSIARTATDQLAALEATGRLIDGPAIDLLQRRPPRTLSGGPLPRRETPAASVVAALLDSDGSYTAVQGPPGTGKTYTGSAVIAEVVQRHQWRVGVVAQSHAAVENMLGAVARAGIGPDRLAKKAGSQSAAWTTVSTDAGRFLTDHRDGCVLGGTAWAFVKDSDFPEPLDLLVIEEAGQFSLANTIAAARNARRVLLLGDPQQLPQVSVGRHHEPVDQSALGWLSAGHDTLPADVGYFLDRTWRMHPAVCEPVSTLAYEGRLTSVAPTRSLDGIEPGVHTVAVEHEGHSVESPEEAERIIELVRSLIGRTWADGGTDSRPLTADDVLVVAPYNAQVALLRAALNSAGFTSTPTGTVDRFQGREAPVVIVSMTASAVDDIPRGTSFLLSRNRLNVAISRGQWAAFIVRSPQLTHHLPTTPAGLPQLGAFLRLSPDRSNPCDLGPEAGKGADAAGMCS